MDEGCTAACGAAKAEASPALHIRAVRVVFVQPKNSVARYGGQVSFSVPLGLHQPVPEMEALSTVPSNRPAKLQLTRVRTDA